MMLFEEHLMDILKFQPEIEAYCGSGDAVRIYSVKHPDQTVLPCVNFSTVANTVMKALTGTIGLAKRRIQIECWAKDMTTASKMRATILDLLMVYRGDFIQSVHHAGVETDSFDGETRSYGAIVHVYMWVASDAKRYVK